MKRLVSLFVLAMYPWLAWGEITLSPTFGNTVTVSLSPSLKAGQVLQIFNGDLKVFDVSISGDIELSEMKAFLMPHGEQLRAIVTGGRDEVAETSVIYDGPPRWGHSVLDERGVKLRAYTSNGGTQAQLTLRSRSSPEKYVDKLRMLTSLGSLTIGLAPNSAVHQTIDMRGNFGERAAAIHSITEGNTASNTSPPRMPLQSSAKPAALETGGIGRTHNGSGTDIHATLPDEERLRSSLQWRCYGQFRVDAPLYFDYLMGKPSKGPGYGTLLQDLPAQTRQRMLKEYGDRVSLLLAGGGRPPTTVYSRMTPERQERQREIQDRRANESREYNTRRYAALLVSGKEVTEEDGRQAIRVLRQAIDRANGNHEQETQCMLTYLEDLFSNKPEDQILADYEDMLARGAQSESHYTCTLAVNLATVYLNNGKQEDARRVINLALPYTNPPFYSAATDRYPRQDCQLVHWLDGNMKYLGLGGARNVQDAGKSFRTCSGKLDICAYNYAAMLLAGEAYSSDKLEAVRLLNRASQSKDHALRAKADDLLKRYSTDATRLAAMLPKAMLEFMVIGGAAAIACSQSPACSAFNKSFDAASTSSPQQIINNEYDKQRQKALDDLHYCGFSMDSGLRSPFCAPQ